MVNKRRQRKSKLPTPVDPTKDRDETQWRNPQIKDRPRIPGNWLKKLSGIRCRVEDCEAINRKMAKFCDQCGTNLKKKN